MAELWLGRLRTQGEKLEMTENAARTIDLAMMTTGLNMGRPFRLPFETKNTYFAPAELHRFFPASVIAWMQAHARPFRTRKAPSTRRRVQSCIRYRTRRTFQSSWRSG